MATLNQSSTIGSGRKNLAVNVLTASDAFTYNANVGQVMLLINPTGGAITAKLVGDAAPASYNAPGGPIGVNLSTGYSLGSLAAGSACWIALDTVAQYLAGNCTIQTGTGLQCIITQDF